VTHDDKAPEFIIRDFQTLKGEVSWVCQLTANGMDMLDAISRLQSMGEYTSDQASMIAIAGVIHYCPQNLPRVTGPATPPPPPPSGVFE
jgi:hypothetical protein